VKDSHSPGSIGSWPVKTGNENILQGTKMCHIIFSTPKGVLFPDAGGLVSRIERRDAACAGRGRDSSGGGVMSGNKPSRDVFDAIADPTRRRIIQLLAEKGELP